MKKISFLLLQVAFGCSLSLLSACSSTPADSSDPEVEVAENFYIGTKAVYAHLSQGSGGSWVLTTVTESDTPPDKGYLVRLNDLAPAFDTRVVECEPQAYPANHRCNPSQPFRDKQIGVVDRIITGGIAAGTAGQVKDFSRTYETVFDIAAFNRAVDEALINTGLNIERREFLTALDEYESRFGSARMKLDTLREQSLSQYNDIANVALNFRPTIVGLTDYYSEDIDFRQIVAIQPRSMKATRNGGLERADILPCDARGCALKARTAIRQIDSSVERERLSMDASLTNVTSEYTVHCDVNSHAGYAFDIQCPESVRKAGFGTEEIPVIVNILSRDFDAIYPEIRIDDDNLSVYIDGDSIRFVNHAPAYLSVTAQTIYYNNQVETRAERIEIAPGATVARLIKNFVTPAIVVESSFKQMTPDKANRITFHFGLAASYRLSSAGAETTLYDRRNFKLGCVIANRLQPGSCRYPERIPAEAKL